MLKKHIFACMMASALVAAPALAQTTAPAGGAPADAGTQAPMTSPGADVQRPATGAPGAPGADATTAAPGAATTTQAPVTDAPATTAAPATTTTTTTVPAGQAAAPVGQMAQPGELTEYLTQQQPGQVMADDLIGTRVVSPTDENIGDISDLILDADGRVVGAIIGVGGFLGIGQKNVGVPFEALQILADAEATAAMPQTGVAPAAPGAAAPGTAAPGTAATAPGTAPAAGGTMGTAGTTATGTGMFGGGDRIDRIVLNATRDQLREAPEFRRLREANRGDAGTGATAPVGGAPAAGTAPAAPGAAPRQ